MSEDRKEMLILIDMAVLALKQGFSQMVSGLDRVHQFIKGKLKEN